MAYTYRFLDSENRVIYVGYTGQSMAKRIGQHFEKGHLPKKAYKSIQRIEYIKWDTKSDAQVMEVYFICKYKPRYNKLNKKTGGDNDTNVIMYIDLDNFKYYNDTVGHEMGDLVLVLFAKILKVVRFM